MIIPVRLISYLHPWRMDPADEIQAFGICRRKFKRFLGLELALTEHLTTPEPKLPEFEYESQVTGYLRSQGLKLFPTERGEITLFLVRPVVKIASNTKREIRNFWGAASGVGTFHTDPSAACSCATDNLRKMPTPYFLSGIMMAHELAHLVGVSHDDSNSNIMNRSVSTWSGLSRNLGFNPRAKQEAQECLK